MNISRGAVNDRAETARRERNARAFVVPQALRAEQINAKEESNKERDEEPEPVFVFQNLHGEMLAEQRKPMIERGLGNPNK